MDAKSPGAKKLFACFTLVGVILFSMHFEKVWVQQCRATRGIRRQFGIESALDYLVGEKLLTFAEVADERSEFASELPRFLAAVWRQFNKYELAG